MKFLKFVLLKENYDTMSAISTIARLLRVNPSTFAYAGTKVLRLSPLSSELLPLTALSSHGLRRQDKRACTVQAVTAHKVEPGRLAALNRQLRGMAIGNFEYCRCTRQAARSPAGLCLTTA